MRSRKPSWRSRTPETDAEHGVPADSLPRFAWSLAAERQAVRRQEPACGRSGRICRCRRLGESARFASFSKATRVGNRHMFTRNRSGRSRNSGSIPLRWHRPAGFPLPIFGRSSVSCWRIESGFWRPGMSSSVVEANPRAQDVLVSEDELTVSLADGRRVSVPLAWFPRLLHASPAQRSNWQLLGDGEGIHWPDVDEDLSVAGILRGTPAPTKSR